MRIEHQKNVYYLDLSKNLYRGYIETSIIRDINERSIIYNIRHLEIEEVVIISELNSIEANFEYLSDSNNKIKIKIMDSFIECIFKIRIKFRPSKDNPAILWYKPVNIKDKHKELIACNNSSPISPYIDTITTVEMYYIIPNTEEIKVVSSGIFKSIKEEDKTIIYLYSCHSNPKNLMFSVGTYDQCDIFNDNDKRKVFTPFIMENDYSEVQSDLQALIKYIEGFTKTQELSTCNIVFSLINVEDCVSKNMIVLKYTLLPSGKDIEMAYVLKRILAECLSKQVYYFLNLTFHDAWIYVGFSGYLSDYCIRYLLGNNEFLYNYFEDKEYVVQEDVLEYPLFYTFRKEEDIDSEFFKKKSRLVFHSMEANLSFAFIQKISDELIQHSCSFINNLNNNNMNVNNNMNANIINTNNTINNTDNNVNISFDDAINESNLSAIINFNDTNNYNNINNSGNNINNIANIKNTNNLNDILNNTNINNNLSTNNTIINKNNINKNNVNSVEKSFTLQFIKIVKDSTGKDLKSFFDFYVFKPGLATIKLQFQIFKKKNTVKVMASYTPTSLLPGANKKIQNNVEIKSVELEGIFDHSIPFGAESTFIYHTRTKKKKKEDEEETMPLLYIRVDPKRLDLFKYTVEQPDYMQIEQLQDKSVIGQLEAIQSLGNKPTLSSAEALERLLDNSHTFYKIRIKTALILRNIKIDEYDGLQRIIQYFIRTRCVPNSTILKSNEFGLISYFIQKHLVSCISNINFKDENLISNSKLTYSFLENILKFNDNSLSQFEDSWYISNVINLYSLHCCFLLCYNSPSFESEQIIRSNFNSNVSLKDCLSELERFRISDMVFPSNNNIITKICILSLIRLAFYKKITINKNTLEPLCLYPNIYSVRLVAIEGMLLLYPSSVSFILKIAFSETSFMAFEILKILHKIIQLNIYYNNNDTSLTNLLIDSIANCMADFIKISKKFTDHIKILSLIKKIQAFIDGKYIKVSEYSSYIISKYDYSKEENNRILILKTTSSTKKLKIANFLNLKVAAFEESHILRLPRIRNFKSKIFKDISQAINLKIKLNPGKFLVKNINNTLIRFKFKKAIRKSDISLILINKYREKAQRMDECITKGKDIGFFPWSPLSSSLILEKAIENNVSYVEIYKEIEKSLVYVLSFNLIANKTYQTAKAIYTYMERLFFDISFVKTKITPLSSEVRDLCRGFLEKLKENPIYSVFLYPVDTTELKNYVDIVRYPISLYEIESRLSEYKSLEAFLYSIERIHINCLRYNDSRSEIVKIANKLKDEIDLIFHSNNTVESIGNQWSKPNDNKLDTKNVIREIIEKYNVENLLDCISVDNIRSWGDLENELVELKKKYTRSSHNGKIVIASIKSIREELKNWFLYDGNKVIMLPEE